MKKFAVLFLVFASMCSMSMKTAFADAPSEEILFFTEPHAKNQTPEESPTEPTVCLAEPCILEQAISPTELEEAESIDTIQQDAEETEPETLYEEVTETVYATTDVNIRSGPGVEYPILGMHTYGSSISRTGIGSNGWSRIIYNGETAYMSSEYLSTFNPISSGNLGTAGRLKIPSVGIDVALYACSGSGEYASEQQRIVDAIDSAAYIEQTNTVGHIIADHNNQGFHAIHSCVPFETYAYINFGTYIQKYICTGIGPGLNLGNDLIDWNGVSLNYDSISGGLAMYTCNEDSTNITITYWKCA